MNLYRTLENIKIQKLSKTLWFPSSALTIIDHPFLVPNSMAALRNARTTYRHVRGTTSTTFIRSAVLHLLHLSGARYYIYYIYQERGTTYTTFIRSAVLHLLHLSGARYYIYYIYQERGTTSTTFIRSAVLHLLHLSGARYYIYYIYQERGTTSTTFIRSAVLHLLHLSGAGVDGSLSETWPLLQYL